jgi:glycosyltransferase involved in cell wall biosynthesis
LGLSNTDRVFLFFGQIRQYKGIDKLLAEFGSILAQDIRLVLAGEPRPRTLFEEVKAQAETDSRVITQLEFVDDDRLVAHICACDMVVLPYRDSLTSGAAILAASYARPILMPRLGCVQEFPATATILYEPEDDHGLRRAFESALSAPLSEMGDFAKRYIEQFPWSSKHNSRRYSSQAKQ